MKNISPKILVSGVVAVILITISIIVVHEQSVATANTQTGILVPSEDSATPIDSTTASSSDTADSSNQTDILSKQVFSNFMVLNQSGNLTDDTVNSLTDQLSSQALGNAPTARVYTSADLKIISNPTVADVKNYGNQLFLLRSKYQNAYIRGAIATSSPYIDQSQTGMMNIFSSLETLYENIVPELLTIPVPAGLVDLHLQLMNTYASNAFGLKQFGQLQTDPVSALSGLNTYNTNSGQEDNVMQQIASYFSNNGIIFSTSDPGYGWNSI